ncbi:bacteriophage abortive infection AbiH family protein [Weissella viridescens]|uniref:AbiH family protein n=1 Tax=Weissella viridescens TaxID=1629 RepID=UPI001C7D4453|nr:AbiH family protein [Weissella viridescens]MBX4172249.1 bacteriophage abortive infection AbiH family protein [Weissella viridescens]
MNNTVRSDAKNLLIIGNGFDLATDLKSSYADFFKWWEDNGKKTNLWGAVFDYYKDLGELDISEETNWKDVESVMAIFLTNDIKEIAAIRMYWEIKHSSSIPTIYVNYVNADGNIDAIRYKALNQLIAINDKLTTFSDKEQKALQDYVCYNSITGYRPGVNMTTVGVDPNVKYRFTKRIPDALFEHWYNLFFDDLHNLEADFTKYLDGCVHEKLVKMRVPNIGTIFEYSAKSSVLEGKLIDNAQTTNILNFNYTNPFGTWDRLIRGIEFDKNVEIGDIKNVHGLTKDFAEMERFNTTEVVFGIDDKFMYVRTGTGEEVINDNLMKFTKTNRIMRFTQTTPNMKLLANVNQIYFYGHSLGAQDYAYFQAIFDSLDIYNSDVELCFEYSQFGDDN